MKTISLVCAAIAVLGGTLAAEPPRILLQSGWQTINIGDIGHTPGTLRYLREHVPEAELSLWLSVTNPQVTAMLQQRFPEVQIVSGSINSSGTASNPSLQAAFDAANLVIQNSGMHYNRFWTPNPALMSACISRGKPFGLYGQSFDGFTPDQANSFRNLLSQASFIYARDSHSLEYLRELPVTPPTLQFGPDGCFGIDVRDDGSAETWLASKGLTEGGFLTVILRSNTPKLQGGDDPLNPAQPTPEQQAEDEDRAAKLREIITHWVTQTGRQVLLAPEVDKEISAAKRLLFDPLPAEIRQRVIHRDTFWNVNEAASVYARSAALVAMEPHSCIIALANGIPSIHYFSRRHGLKAYMFEDLGLSEWLHEIDQTDPQAIIDELDRIVADPDAAAAKVEGAMQRVEKHSAAMSARIREVLGLPANPGFQVPAAPPIPNATSFDAHRVDFSWPPVAQATHSWIEKRALPDGAWIHAGQTLTPETSLVTRGLTPNTSYAFRLHHSGPGGNSPPSPEIEITTARSAPLGLIAHWKFDGPAGLIETDASGAGRHLEFGGHFERVDGRRAEAVRFAGPSDAGFLPSALLPQEIRQMTLAFWVKPTGLNGSASHFPVSKRMSFLDGTFSLLFWTGNKLYIDFGGNNDRFSSNQAFVNDVWRHVAVVFDGSQPAATRARLYVDGSLEKTAFESSSVLPPNQARLWIGQAQDGSGTGFTGMIDDVRIYLSALDDGQIAAVRDDNLPADQGLDFPSWLTRHFQPAELENQSVAGPLATPAHDGIANLTKFQLGLEPRRPARNPLTTTLADSNAFNVRFDRVRGLAGVNSTAEFSTNMRDWTGVGAVESVVASTAGWEQVQWSFPVSGQRSCFGRIKVW